MSNQVFSNQSLKYARGANLIAELPFNQPIAENTPTQILFINRIPDGGTGIPGVVNAFGVFTIFRSGTYNISATATFATNPLGDRDIWIEVNGLPVPRFSHTRVAANPSGLTIISASLQTFIPINGIIQVFVRQLLVGAGLDLVGFATDPVEFCNVELTRVD